MQKMIAAVGLMLAGATPAAAQDSPTLYSGGPIITMAGDTPELVEAVVTQGGIIRFIGARREAKHALVQTCTMSIWAAVRCYRASLTAIRTSVWH